jgi:probable blue pigment (indigoidine) exporter
VLGERLVDQFPAGIGECDDTCAVIARAGTACDQPAAFKPVDALGHSPRGDHGERGELSGCTLEGFTSAPEGGEYIELPLPEPIAPVDDTKLFGEVVCDAVEPPDHTLWLHIHVGSFTGPGLLDAADMVEVLTHVPTIASMEDIVASMEGKFRWVSITAIAPVAWGTTYFVTHRFLPADYPLYGAAIRALPAGLLLLLVRRKRPHGSWWWKSLVLGTMNMGAFFALVYLAAQTLPTTIASTIMATSPIVMMLFAWAALSVRPRTMHMTGAGIGIGGVCLMLLDGASTVDASGVFASIMAMVMSSLGYVLAKKWSADVDVFSLTSWQLIAGGVVLMPVAVATEGLPPTLDGPALIGFSYVTVVATALAFAAWFTGLRHLSAGTVGLIGLLNPMTGVLLGTVVAGETLAVQQICGLVLVFLGILLGILLGQPFAARLVTLVGAGRSRHTTHARPGSTVRDHESVVPIPECQ